MGWGYIIGPRIAVPTVRGAAFAYLVLMPAIKLFAADLGAMLGATKLIAT